MYGTSIFCVFNELWYRGLFGCILVIVNEISGLGSWLRYNTHYYLLYCISRSKSGESLELNSINQKLKLKTTNQIKNHKSNLKPQIKFKTHEPEDPFFG